MRVTASVELAAPWSYAIVALSFYIILIVKSWISQSKIPVVGVHSIFELGLVSNLRFYKNAEAILLDGYTKVSLSFLTQTTVTNLESAQKSDLPIHQV